MQKKNENEKKTRILEMECSIYQRQGKTQNEDGISILVSGATQRNTHSAP